MNLVESARKRILNGNFLTEEELSQVQYELVTDPRATSKEIFKLHDALFGSNLSGKLNNSLDEGPFVCLDAALDEQFTDELETPDDSEGGELVLSPA